jgi:hypothetical protein
MSATKSVTPALIADNLGASIASSGVIPSLDELIFALSCISHVCEHAPTVPSGTAQQRKHLSLLDGLALFLVTEDRGDVAAVSFAQSSTSVDFYYAKNRPCKASMTEYVESLLKEVRNYEPSKKNEFIVNIVKKAASMCIRKVRSRIRKVCTELAKCEVTIDALNFDDGNINNIQIWRSTGEPEGTMGMAFAKGYSYFKSTPPKTQLNQPDTILLAHYFRFALRMDKPTNELRQRLWSVLELMIISYHVGIISPLR